MENTSSKLEGILPSVRNRKQTGKLNSSRVILSPEGMLRVCDMDFLDIYSYTAEIFSATIPRREIGEMHEKDSFPSFRRSPERFP